MSRRAGPASSAGSHAAFLGAAVVLAAIVYHGAPGTFFAQDDITFLSRAAGLEPADWSFRPLSAGLAFRLAYALFGLRPFGFHLVDLLLHLLAVAGVYALAARLSRSPAAAGGAAVLFGASSIAFTPLHWATGVIESLTTTLLLGATLLHLRAGGHGSIWRWAGAAAALLAMLSKETAIAWIVLVVFIEWRSGGGVARTGRALLPAATAGIVFAACFLGSRHGQLPRPSVAYAVSASPVHLFRNLFTYLEWSVPLHRPIPDVIALPDPGAWHVALPLAVLLGLALWQRRPRKLDAFEAGIAWWLAFLLPVLPLARHTYLYYLYIPMVGGAIAAAAIGWELLTRWSGRHAASIGLVCLGAYVVVEARNVEIRETATQDALPVDRTLRDATLLRHALPALARARLAPGTKILFVNPVPGAAFDLVTGARTRPQDQASRTSYRPLEAAFRDGETLRLFLPGITYLGFANTIPLGRQDAECFYYEQRGWLERLGHGQRALMRQAEIQRAAQSWAAAESSFRRVRALGDTLPEALRGQVTCLAAMGRTVQARSVAEEYLRRWPGDSSIDMHDRPRPRPYPR